MAYKQKGSPFQRNFKIGSPAKQMLKPRVAPTAAPMGAPAAPPPPPVDPAMVAQAAEAVKGAMAPPPVDPGAEMPPPTQRNLRMEAESPMKFMGMVARRAARRAARPKTGSVNQPTTGGPQKGIVSTTPLPGGDKEGVKRTGGRRGLLGGLARGVKSVGKAVKGAVGGGMSGIAKAKSAAKGGGMSGIAKAKSAVKNVGGLAKGVSLGGAVNAVKQKVIKK
jgi:hypothetical protein